MSWILKGMPRHGWMEANFPALLLTMPLFQTYELLQSGTGDTLEWNYVGLQDYKEIMRSQDYEDCST